MRLRSRPSARRRVRPAPSGVWVPESRNDRRPDGWPSLESRPRDALRSSADRYILRASDRIARITRRRFIRRTGEIAFALGVGVSQFAWIPKARADFGPFPCNEDDPNNVLHGPCGPSPLCDDSHCNSNFECEVTDAGVQRRGETSFTPPQWPGFDCVSDTRENCWRECCSGSLRRCCDCCTNANTTPHCTNCGSTKHACICRGNLGIAC
jgi:hypothetical protein